MASEAGFFYFFGVLSVERGNSVLKTMPMPCVIDDAVCLHQRLCLRLISQELSVADAP